MEVDEVKGYLYDSSVARMETLKTYPQPMEIPDVLKMLSDTSNYKFPVFNDHGPVRTLAVGLFDCKKRTWSIYADNPSTNERLVVVPLEIVDNKSR